MKVNSMPSVPMAAEKTTQVKAQQEADSFAKLLERAKENNDHKALKEASRQFESYFLQQMLKGMRSTIPQGDLIPKSYAQDIYEGMLDEQYAEKMSESGGIGLAKLIYEDMTRRNK